jgi:hypothetical protein
MVCESESRVKFVNMVQPEVYLPCCVAFCRVVLQLLWALSRPLQRHCYCLQVVFYDQRSLLFVTAHACATYVAERLVAARLLRHIDSANSLLFGGCTQCSGCAL